MRLYVTSTPDSFAGSAQISCPVQHVDSTKSLVTWTEHKARVQQSSAAVLLWLWVRVGRRPRDSPCCILRAPKARTAPARLFMLYSGMFADPTITHPVVPQTLRRGKCHPPQSHGPGSACALSFCLSRHKRRRTRSRAMKRFAPRQRDLLLSWGKSRDL
jgi:hypothetical protein